MFAFVWEIIRPESVIEWFADFYKETKKKGAPKPIECVTRPGELMFIPSGWWHTVLNLEESVAVTQNFVSSQNLHRVYDFLKSKKKHELFEAFETALAQKRPDLLAKMRAHVDNAPKTKEKKEQEQQNQMWEDLFSPTTDASTTATAPQSSFSLLSMMNTTN
jgi:mannose-6-phosphate isomerase class I